MRLAAMRETSSGTASLSATRSSTSVEACPVFELGRRDGNEIDDGIETAEGLRRGLREADGASSEFVHASV